MKVPAQRLDAAFARCRAAGEGALVAYVMGGDPDLATSRAMALACAEGGADVLEIGVPFSDPIADGPTIQAAAERALAHRTSLFDCLALAASVRAASPVPIVLMGYVNPILSYGERRFLEHCSETGVNGLIVPDLPPEEARSLSALAAARNVRLSFLVAPTSTPRRLEAACRATTGFVYVVSVTGVTGARRALAADVERSLAATRKVATTPVVVGFGISRPDQARALAPHADGVVVGSAIVSRIAEGGPTRTRAARVRRFVRSLKSALR
jgi:tryptophan synthase alpha chain